MVTTNDTMENEVCAADVQVTPQADIVNITEEDFEKAQKTFQLGKKNLFLNKYDESVSNIGEACKIFSTKFGEFDPQCGEVYFFYGRALLELARVESTVLGNALNGVPEDTEPIDDSRYGNPEDVAAEEKKEISEKVIDALCEDKAAAPVATEESAPAAATESTEMVVESTTEKPAEDKPVSEEAVTEAKKEETPKEGEEAAAGEEGEDDEEEGDEEEEEGEDITKGDEQAKDEAEAEEISNLQRAWEMFELAKLVYTKNTFENDPTFNKNKRIAECLMKLGEISIEQEIYEQAITDITESIRLQEELALESRDERMLAESFYQLGLAQQFNNQFNEANESYQKSINIMQLKLEKLRGKLSQLTEQTDADSELEKTTIKDEIAELEALLPEMTSKLEEVNEQGQQSLNLIKEAKECFMNTITEATKATNGGEVKDITSLVKSKRKISESPSSDSNGLKKTKCEDDEAIEVTEAVAENAAAAATETPIVTDAVPEKVEEATA